MLATDDRSNAVRLAALGMLCGAAVWAILLLHAQFGSEALAYRRRRIDGLGWIGYALAAGLAYFCAAHIAFHLVVTLFPTRSDDPNIVAWGICGIPAGLVGTVLLGLSTVRLFGAPARRILPRPVLAGSLAGALLALEPIGKPWGGLAFFALWQGAYAASLAPLFRAMPASSGRRMTAIVASLLVAAFTICTDHRHQALAATVPTDSTEPAELAQARDILRRALEKAGAVENQSQRARLLHEIALAQAKAGDVPAAIETAHLLREHEIQIFPEGRALVEIGELQALSGDRAGAMMTYRRAFELWIANGARRVSGGVCAVEPCYYPQVAVMSARMPKEALGIAQLLPDPSERALMMLDVRRMQIEDGEQAAAAETLRLALVSAAAIEDPLEKIQVLAQAGSAFDAQTIAAAIPDDSWNKLRALQGVAQAQANAGEFAEALRTIAAIPLGSDPSFPQWIKDEGLRDIARTQVEVGDFLGALKTAANIDNGYTKGLTVGYIAEAQEKSGDSERALLTAAGIDDWNARSSALAEIAVIRSETGNHAGALRLTAQINDDISRFDALQVILKTREATEDIPEALKIVTRIESDRWRALALTHIAEMQAKFGDCGGGVDTARHALESWSAAATNGTTWLEGYAAFAAEMGDAPTALQIAANSQSDLRDIAESQAIAGEIPMALGTVAMIERDFEKAEGFRRVAYAQADAGDATNALSWGATQGRSLSNGYALLGIAEGLLERVRPSPARFGYWWRSGDRSHHDLAGRRALALCSRK